MQLENFNHVFDTIMSQMNEASINDTPSVDDLEMLLPVAKKYIELYNKAGKEFKRAFADIGARMWRHDYAHSLRTPPEELVKYMLTHSEIDNENLKTRKAGILKHYIFRRPLTALGAYPEARKHRGKLDSKIDEILTDYHAQFKKFVNDYFKTLS